MPKRGAGPPVRWGSGAPGARHNRRGARGRRRVVALDGLWSRVALCAPLPDRAGARETLGRRRRPVQLPRVTCPSSNSVLAAAARLSPSSGCGRRLRSISRSSLGRPSPIADRAPDTHITRIAAGPDRARHVVDRAGQGLRCLAQHRSGVATTTPRASALPQLLALDAQDDALPARFRTSAAAAMRPALGRRR
jgi:hypothetical protein